MGAAPNDKIYSKGHFNIVKKLIPYRVNPLEGTINITIESTNSHLKMLVFLEIGPNKGQMELNYTNMGLNSGKYDANGAK